MRLVVYSVVLVPVLAVFVAASFRDPSLEPIGLIIGACLGIFMALVADGRVGPDSAVANFLFGRRERRDDDE